MLELPARQAWDEWLSQNHDDSAGVWFKLAKKGAPRATVTQAQALEVALCHGWIDGQVGRLDEHFYKQRFTHRKPRSNWSQINCGRATELIATTRTALIPFAASPPKKSLAPQTAAPVSPRRTLSTRQPWQMRSARAPPA